MGYSKTIVIPIFFVLCFFVLFCFVCFVVLLICFVVFFLLGKRNKEKKKKFEVELGEGGRIENNK